MSRPSEDDREATDRAFADLVAGYHLTADRPDPMPPAPPPSDHLEETPWAGERPLFRFAEPPEEEPAEAEERFVPEPPPPLPKPAWPVLLSWIAMGYALLAMLAAVLGAHLPTWAGWMAVAGFVGGLAILATRLPRHRPPDAGDGAVL